MLVLDLAHESNQHGEQDAPIIVAIFWKKDEHYHLFDTFDVQELATLMVNGAVREWQMLEGKRIREYVVARVIRLTRLATKYQRGTSTIPAFVEASW